MNYILTDRDKAFTILLSFDGEINLSERITNPDRRKDFIEIAKEFIDCDFSKDFYLEFSSDYSKIRKIKKHENNLQTIR